MNFDYDAARRSMIERQLKPRGIRNPRLLAALARVPRERFVPEDLAGEAYADGALPIDCQQTISQPIIVAMMTDALQLSGHEKVLEIGTGSGYQTAILAQLAGEVYSIERHGQLSLQSQERLASLGCENVMFKVGDGARGWPEFAPYDRILITAAAVECPPALWEQLAEGGILVGPFGPPREQLLTEMHKVEGKPVSQSFTACRFVPLVTGKPNPPA